MDILLAQMLQALTSKTCWHKFRHYLIAPSGRDDDMVWNTQAIALYSTIDDLHQRSTKDVSLDAVEGVVRASFQGTRQAELLDCIQAIAAVEVEHDQAAHTVATYIAQAKAAKAVQLVSTHRNSPVFDYSVPARLLADAANITSGTNVPCVEVRDAPLPGDPELARKAVPLGLSAELDAHLMGGVGRGELLVLLAPFGRGKTSYLWRMAANATMAGHHVWAATLEINKNKCFSRYYQCLTYMTNTELIMARRTVARKRKQVTGKLWVSDYSHLKLTPDMVQREVEIKRAEGMPVDYVMIDYAEIMSRAPSIRKRDVDWLELGELVIDLRRVANALDVPIVTAWQVGRAGSTRYVFGPEDIGRSWEVVKHADILLGLNQTSEEADNNAMRVKVMKQREDTTRALVFLHSDLRRMKISALEES